MKQKIIVSDLGRIGYKIYRLLRQQGAFVVGIADRPVPKLANDNIIIGDLRSGATLINAGIKEAHTLILASHNDALNLAILTTARAINPNIRIINRLYNQTLGDRLDSTLPNHISMSVSSLAAPIFAFAAMGNQAIGQLSVFNQTWPIHEEIIHENHPWYNKKLKDLWSNSSRMLIYYLPKNEEKDLVTGVVQGARLDIGDRIIVANKPQVNNKKGFKIKKFFKAIFNVKQYQQYGGPFVIVTLALFVTIFIATTTYVCVNLNTNIIDAVYFTVGMITGAGGNEEIAEQSFASIKIFTSIMMLVGTAVVGICYALINDFILGSRIKQFWDAARVPNGNHYIVCGLGGIAMEIVRHLLQAGQEVVVIESDPNNRFLHSIHSLDVPVIIQDATLVNTLKAANIETAAAILPVTSNDMVNVEIALTAKGVVPKLPVIIRIYDHQFVQEAREVFQFESAFCSTDLATHSFAAAALGGRILGNGMVDNLLWVALATMISPNHPFYQKSVKDAAMMADFVPLYLERNQTTIHNWDLLDTYLEGGDILFLTMPANKLQLLWRSSSETELIFHPSAEPLLEANLRQN